MKIKKGKTSEIFSCRDCDKLWEDSETARKNAYSHAKKTGHRVVGDVTKTYHYN